MVEGLRRPASKCSSTYRDQNFSRVGTGACSMLLPRNEVKHARVYAAVALVVVSEISLGRDSNQACGGSPNILHAVPLP